MNLSHLQCEMFGTLQHYLTKLPLQVNARTGRRTVEHIFNCIGIIEKHLQLKPELFNNFIYFKKASDHMWHDCLW